MFLRKLNSIKYGRHSDYLRHKWLRSYEYIKIDPKCQYFICDHPLRVKMYERGVQWVVQWHCDVTVTVFWISFASQLPTTNWVTQMPTYRTQQVNLEKHRQIEGASVSSREPLYGFRYQRLGAFILIVDIISLQHSNQGKKEGMDSCHQLYKSVFKCKS